MTTFLRPTSYATWASGPSGYTTEPIAADKAQGFLPTGIARSSYANWLWGVAGAWHAYLGEQRDGMIGASLTHAGLVAGFTAGASASVQPGAIYVAATGAGATGATSPALARGTIMQEMVPLAMGAMSASGTAYAAMGVQGSSQISAGNYSVRLANPASATTRAIVIANMTPNVGLAGGAMFTTNTCLFNTRTASGTLQSNDFHWVIYNV